MIGSLLSKMATAGELSIPQLQQAMQNGTIPPYIVLPVIDEKLKQQQQAQGFAGAQQQNQPTIAEQVMQAANQVTQQAAPQMMQQPAPQMPMQEQAPQGIASAQSNLPTEYAGGGIVAFGNDKLNPNEDQVVKDKDEGFFKQFVKKIAGPSKNMMQIREAQIRQDQARKETAAPPTPFMQDIAGIGTGLKENVLNPAISGISELGRKAKGYFIDPALNPRDVEAQEGGFYGGTPSTVTPAPVTPSLVVNRDKGGPKGSPKGPELMPMYEGIFANPNAPAVAPTPDTAVAPTKEGIDQLTAVTKDPDKLTSDLDEIKKIISGGYADQEKALTQKALIALSAMGAKTMAGTSENPFTNFGQGAETGVASLAKGIDELDANKRREAEQLTSIGLKGIEFRNDAEKTRILGEHYGAQNPLYGAQTAEILARTAAIPTEILLKQGYTLAQIEHLRMQNKLIQAKIATAGKSGQSSLGSIPTKALWDRQDKYNELAANPRSDPKFFSMLSPGSQMSLEKTDPKSKSYQDALGEAKILAKNLFTNDVRLGQILGAKKSRSPFSSDDDY